MAGLKWYKDDYDDTSLGRIGAALGIAVGLVVVLVGATITAVISSPLGVPLSGVGAGIYTAAMVAKSWQRKSEADILKFLEGGKT